MIISPMIEKILGNRMFWKVNIYGGNRYRTPLSGTQGRLSFSSVVAWVNTQSGVRDPFMPFESEVNPPTAK